MADLNPKLAPLTISATDCIAPQKLWRLEKILTNERCGTVVDNATGQQVEIIFNRIHHHSVACVVATLKRRTIEHL